MTIEGHGAAPDIAGAVARRHKLAALVAIETDGLLTKNMLAGLERSHRPLGVRYRQLVARLVADESRQLHRKSKQPAAVRVHRRDGDGKLAVRAELVDGVTLRDRVHLGHVLQGVRVGAPDHGDSATVLVLHCRDELLNHLVVERRHRAVEHLEDIEHVEDLRDVAVKNATFLREALWRDGRLMRTHRSGRSKGNGYLEDYACLANGLLSLYEATFDLRWFTWARELGQVMIEQFGDRDRGGFYDTEREHEALILRPQDLFDNAMPSGNSSAAEALLRLSAFTGDAEEERWGRSALSLVLPALGRYPTGFGHLLCAAEFAIADRKEVAIVGPQNSEATRALLRAVFGPYRPSIVVAGAEPGDDAASSAVPLLEGRVQRVEEADGSLAYVCEHFTCRMPVSDAEELSQQLAAAG